MAKHKRKSNIGLPPHLSRDDAYIAGIADGEASIREYLSDSVAILKEELARAWLTDPARIALNTLENFINEKD